MKHSKPFAITLISALRFDPHMIHLAREAHVPLILMHMQGIPKDMQLNPVYDDLLGEIKAFFRERLDFAVSQGLSRNLLILDPGIGFGKTFDHNLEIMNNIHLFLDLGCPLLVGPSRKAFIGHLLGLPAGELRDVGTLAALAMAALGGARILRVHHVAYASQFLTVLQAIRDQPLHESAGPLPFSRKKSVVMGDWRAQDDFNGDGLVDAAVVLITDSGDCIRLYDLAIIANENGIPIEAANDYLGGEIRVEGFCAEGGKLYITIQYPGSPQEQQVVYELDAGLIQAR